MKNRTADKDKVISIAAEVFAEKGFEQATVREICKKAKVNIAAINYYWGSKEKLYKQVIEKLIIERTRVYPFTAAMDQSLPPQMRLRKFIELFLNRLLDSDRPAWSSKIMIREMFQPTEEVKMVLDKLIKPTYELLVSILGDIYTDKVAESKVRLTAVSIISQCVFYFYADRIMSRMVAKKMLPEFKIDEVVEHITKFSLQGIGCD
jgi:TetR/AcrR family transcriptional regulator, regulator of cefoperazone and chloramphenicol sensitivity